MSALNYKIIYRFLGLTAILNGIFMFLTLPFSLYYQEDATYGILNSGIITVSIGLLLYFFNKPTTTNIQKKEGYIDCYLRMAHPLYYWYAALFIERCHT